ncbi:MAG: gephyrin-like molybdotransferase Glp [Pseudomonadota bacterium]|nr:gephyrin-like molybdotransferase Glp [Pseudomonadota bacterium]
MPELLPVKKAKDRICEAMPLLPIEQVPLTSAVDRILAADVISRRTQPPFAVSAMDGYAVQFRDLLILPKRLSIVGEVPAGKKFDRTISSGEAVRIFTGARVPDGADTIIIQENTIRDGDFVVVKEGEAEPGQFIRPAGLDFSEGEKLLEAPKKLTARDIGLAASMNVPWLKVRKKPNIALLATGDEIVMPGDPCNENQIVSSNVIGLHALVDKYGGHPIDLGIARDDAESLLSLAKGALSCDLLITTGGASVGDHDLVKSVLANIGLEVDFWRIAMRPGKPLIFGKIGSIPLLGLPGNPVSSMVCAIIFLLPAIAAMQGLRLTTPSSKPALLGSALPVNDDREDYLRATLSEDQSGGLIATPFQKQDSSVFSGMSAADCLIIRPPFAPAVEQGEQVSIIALD